jgi:copper chaperone CopZ
MTQNVAADQLAVIRVGGMHCHKCEALIQRKLGQIPGVHEAEVDFNSGQASVLFNRAQANVEQLLQTIRDAGYQATIAHH